MGPIGDPGHVAGMSKRPCPLCGSPMDRLSKRCASCSGYGTKRNYTHPAGYVRIWVPGHPMAHKDGYALEHRYVLHEAGVEIPDGLCVHHVNGDPKDNRLENLAVVTASEHRRLHSPYTVEESHERQLARTRAWRKRNRAHINEYKRKRVAAGIPWGSA